MGRKGRGLLISFALVATGLVAPSSAAPARGHCSTAETPLYTLEITGEPQEDVYHVGDVVKVDVLVVRYADHDPINGDIPITWPMDKEPAPDVEVGGGIRVGETNFYGYAITDENGEGTVEIKLRSYAHTGKAVGYLSAWKYVFRGPSDCPAIVEKGYGEIPEFTVKK